VTVFRQSALPLSLSGTLANPICRPWTDRATVTCGYGTCPQQWRASYPRRSSKTRRSTVVHHVWPTDETDQTGTFFCER
jgi:hypothetical protein